MKQIQLPTSSTMYLILPHQKNPSVCLILHRERERESTLSMSVCVSPTTPTHHFRSFSTISRAHTHLYA